MICNHLDLIEITETETRECEECRKSGDRWVHLRMCLTCGAVRCCDSSPNRHARKHYMETGHPLMRSVEPGETWRYCYEDGLYLTARNRPVRRG